MEYGIYNIKLTLVDKSQDRRGPFGTTRHSSRSVESTQTQIIEIMNALGRTGRTSNLVRAGSRWEPDGTWNKMQ